MEYKASTRRHIEKLGYDIVLNVGDQWSDLQGGYADRVLKLPNPTYYLPSPNLPGVDEPRLAPRTHFTMKPDGSSGARRDGEGIPNIDSVKSTIRTYYAATDGISNKTSSPYISEVTAIAAPEGPDADEDLRHGEGSRQEAGHRVRCRRHHAVDLRHGGRGRCTSTSTPSARTSSGSRSSAFPATPGMVDLVNEVGAAGCTIVGLTGRNDDQKAATLGNLAKVGYTGLHLRALLHEVDRGGHQPAAVATCTCAAAKCTTIEYKSQTRKHVDEDLGYDIVANFGDQFSDLIGGHARRQVKLPNPTYYLP